LKKERRNTCVLSFFIFHCINGTYFCNSHKNQYDVLKLIKELYDAQYVGCNNSYIDERDSHCRKYTKKYFFYSNIFLFFVAKLQSQKLNA